MHAYTCRKVYTFIRHGKYSTFHNFKYRNVKIFFFWSFMFYGNFMFIEKLSCNKEIPYLLHVYMYTCTCTHDHLLLICNPQWCLVYH